jgi:hypothetical protein
VVCAAAEERLVSAPKPLAVGEMRTLDLRDLGIEERFTKLAPYLNTQHGVRQEQAGVYLVWRRP